MSSRFVVGIALTACLLIGVAMSVVAQSGAKNGEWPAYGADLGNTHYSPLDQINSGNFSKLQVAWRFKTNNLGPAPEFNLESTPLMGNGVLYSTAGTRRAVVAIDAATGELLWTHGEHEGPRGEAAPRQLSGRGLAYWTDGREQRILYVTPGYRLIALDARTGSLVTSFGRNGGLNVQGLPLAKPPYGSITAIDLDKGDIIWQIAHGETPDNIRNHPALKGLTIPRTGRPGVFGVLVTKTGNENSGHRGRAWRLHNAVRPAWRHVARLR